MFFSWLDWVLWGRSQRWRALASARSIWLITEVQVDLDLTWPRSCLSACSTESAHFFPFLYCTLRKKPFCLFWVSKKRACVSSSDCLTEFSTSNLLFVVQGTLFSHSVVSHSLQHHRLQHARLPCPSLFPGVCSNSCPLSRWCHPAISSSFPASGSFPMNESTLRIRWPKYWSFSFNISPSDEYSGLISFRMDWLDLLAVQETLQSLLQHHSSKASILRCSAFFIVQLSHPYMTTRKTRALTRRTFVGKVTSLLFNVLSRFVITFFPRSKHLLNSWLKSSSTVI